MKKTMLLMLFAILLIPPAVSCGKQNDEQSGNTIVYSDDYQLNDRQKNILTAEGLSTDFSKLEISQKRSIQRIEQMLCYLETNYGTEFVYSGYIEQGINESEKLYAYPKNIGARQTITVKAKGDGFTDDYYDYSVADYAEELIDGYLSEQFSKEDYRYFASTNACDIKMSEIVDANFQWKYGASNIIFIKADVCNMDEVEEFAVNYAKFLYEHQIGGDHRINIMCYFPDIEFVWGSGDWYRDAENEMGFYCFSIHPTSNEIIMDNTVYSTDENGKVITHNNNPVDYVKTMETYSIEEYLAKYD
ncbi:MAG: hypothetical protein J6B75_01655 [Ruminococcus sp.]|nr:hypothetical protein [Ruminococcus sp.]